MTEEEIQAQIKAKLVKMAEAEKIQQYQEKLQQESLGTFTDVPDPVAQIRVIESFGDSVVIEWDPPCGNNQEIISYHIFQSRVQDPKTFEQIDKIEAVPDPETGCMVYTVRNLDEDQFYFLKVNAENSMGLGYPADQPSMVHTMSSIEQPGDLYVWGNNSNSEIGLTDELVDQHKANFH